MIHITSLPSSLAKPLSDYYLPHDSKLFTFSGFYDEETLFSDISKKLKSLEISNDNNQTELETIIYLVEQIQVPHEKKDEFLTRVNWLQRLYKAMADMGSVDTKEKLKQLRNLIAPVQTCPLKIQLMAGLDSLEVSLPDEATVSVEPTVFELLMEKAINEAGDKFFNLGKTGRDYVIAEVLKQEGDHATTAHVQDLAYQLEQRVLTLSEVSDWVEMIAELDQLPLSVFPTLQDLKKERVAEALIQEKRWTGLFSLERKITQISNAIDREEREKYEKENVIDLPDGKAAATLDLRYNPID